MDFSNVKIPDIVPAVEALNTIRNFTPDKLLSNINDKIQNFIENHDFILDDKSQTTFRLIDYLCKGYTLQEVKCLIKILIKSYKKKGYNIKYKVCIEQEYNSYCVMFIIKSLQIKMPNIKANIVVPPNYSEAVNY